MYQHLLVPLDGTELSIGNVTAAVRFADALGARATFFHAMPSPAMHPPAPRRPVGSAALPSVQDFQAQALAAGRALMAKACAAAAARGVRYDTLCVVGDRPSEAIVRAARQCGCDLIVMASHGVGSLRMIARASQTLNVVRATNIPVLITRVQATDRHAAASRAVALIHDEHRSLAAVIQGMLRLVTEARAPGGAGFDRVAFDRMLDYVIEFPVQRHHPRESQSLHRLLRARGGRGRDLVETLEAQHLEEYDLVTSLRWACEDVAAGARIDAGSSLADALDAFAAHVWGHLKLEEYTLIPLALDVLTDADWAEVARAFEANQDPGYGGWSDDDFRREFATIAGDLPLPQAHESPAHL